jgi:formylglycine-generating enzyme required for sulfatase activity
MLNRKISKTFFILALLSSLLFFAACEEDSPVEPDDVVLDGVDVLLIETWDTYEMQEDGELLIPVLVEEQSLKITKHDMMLNEVSVIPADHEIYFEENQIFVTDGEVDTYLYDYYFNNSSKALWLKEDDSNVNTLADSLGNPLSPLEMEDVDLNEYTLYFVSGQGPSLNLLTPGDGFYVNSLMADDSDDAPKFTWSEYIGANQYTIVCATDEELNNLVFEVTTDDTEYIHDTELDNFTDYYWQVKAENSVWSEIWGFTTNYVVTLNLPNNDGSTSLKPKFDWEELDGASEYTLQVSNSGDFDTVLYEEVLTVTEFNIPEYLEENNTYFWRVKTDTSGDHWSETRLFHTDIVVTPSSPENESTEIAVPVIFSWAQLDNADTYTIQVATDEEMADIVLEEQFAAAGNWTEPGILTANVDGYYWRITSDVAVGWSDINYFITNDGVFLNSPADSAQQGVIVKFEWLEYSSAGGYQIQVATDDGFSDLIIDAEVDEDVLEYISEIDFDLASTYYWRVKATVSGWSEVREFTTISQYIEEDVVLLFPADDSENDAVAQAPSFVWERLAGSNFYRIQVSESSDFSDVLIEETRSTPNYAVGNGDALTYNSVYYWRVRTDVADWCDAYVFRVKSGVAELESVGNFAFKVDLIWNDRTELETGFEIERSSSADGTYELVGTSDANYNSFVDVNLEENTTYFYRGRTLSPAGDSEYWEPLAVTTASFDGLMNQPEMVAVTAGTFSMGSSDGDADEAPVHDVTLTNNFEIGKYEVSNAEFAEVMNWALAKGLLTRVYTANSDPISYEEGYGPVDNAENQSKYIKASGICQVSFSNNEKKYVVEPGFEDYPVSDVTWFGAALYANCLSAIDGLDQVYDYWDSDVYGSNGYRLPTEAEWEFTAQYNDGRLYPWGDSEPTDELANYYDMDAAENSMMPVGSYSAGNNQLGIADLAGNVWEWCNDVYDEEYYSSSPASDPEGPAIGIESSPFVRAVIRGGSWEMPANTLRNANRSMSKPNLDYGRTNTAIGFRVLKAN